MNFECQFKINAESLWSSGREQEAKRETTKLNKSMPIPVQPPPRSMSAQTLDVLNSAVEMNRETLEIAHNSNDRLAFQEQQIRCAGNQVEHIDKQTDRADIQAGKVDSCCGYGFWHWLKIRCCCMGGDAVRIRESNHAELERREALAREPFAPPAPPLPVVVVSNDPIDQAIDVLEHQVEELKEDALVKKRELALQNTMLDVLVAQTRATGQHVQRVTRYERQID